MRGTISKIHPIKRSRNGNSFVRVEFKLEDGRWAKTDLCPDFRNYNRWKDLLRIGQSLIGLNLKQAGEVDADSFPLPFRDKSEENCEWVQQPDGSMALIKKTPAVKVEPLPPVEAVQEKLL